MKPKFSLKKNHQLPLALCVAALVLAVVAAVLFWPREGSTGTDTAAGTPAPLPTATPAPTEPPVALARIRAAGDIIIDTPMLTAAQTSGTSYKFDKYFNRIGNVLEDADWTIINIEGALAGMGEYGYTGYPSFNTPPVILDTLKKRGVDMLTLANNHSLDRYFDGLMNTLRNVDKAGLARTGAYRSQKDYDKPLVVDINGIQIGFTNYTTGLNNVEKRSDKRATQYGLRTTAKADYAKDIAALRDAGAQAVVVMMHWDREYKRQPGAATKQMAQQIADAGADVIIGGHPHMVQPLEWLSAADGRKVLCLYSMGNFLSNHKGPYLDNGIVFEVSFALDKHGAVRVVNPCYIPVWVWVQKSDDALNYQVMPAAAAIRNRPETMTDEQYERVTAAWRESLEILGTEIAAPIMN